MDHQEKHLILAFFSKVSELILQMRYDSQLLAHSLNNQSKPTGAITSTTTTRNTDNQFGISLSKQSYGMSNLISNKWNTASFTPLTIEFFLQRKSDSTNLCVEQWQFNYEKTFGYVPFQNAKSTTRKSNKSEEILAVLLRCVASLLVQTPLWKHYISSNNTRAVKSAYILDYKVSFAQNQLIKGGEILSGSEIKLSAGSIFFRCCVKARLQEVLQVPTTAAAQSTFVNQPFTNKTSHLYNESCMCKRSNICICNKLISHTSQMSTANSTPEAYSSPSQLNSYLQNQLAQNAAQNEEEEESHSRSKKFEHRERFLSEKIDPTTMLFDNNSNTHIQNQFPSNTRERCSTVSSSSNHKKQSYCSSKSNRFETYSNNNNNNNTFRFSFSENEPLSDEEKNIINHHLRQSSVVSVYSRKDDITIVSTPEEIALKVSDSAPSELSGLELEMVLEEQQQLPLHSHETYPTRKDRETNSSSMKKTSELKTNQHSFAAAPPTFASPLKNGQQESQQIKEITRSEQQVNVQDDDFDFQLIEEENDRPIDLAISALNELINAHKIERRFAKHSQSAFQLFSSLTRFVDNY